MIQKLIHRLTNIPDNFLALILFLIAFLLRLVYVIIAFSNNIMASFSDDNGYFYLAKEIVNRGEILYDVDIHLYAEMVGPGLPWVNALTISLFGESWLGIFVVSSLVSAFITFFTFKVASCILDKSTAMLAGLWSCFYFFYIDFSATAGKDIFIAFFLIVIVYLLIQLFQLKKFSYLNFLLLIIAYTYLFHLDERFLIYSPLIFLYIMFSETGNFKRFQIKKSFLFFLLVVILTIPWVLRNFQKLDKFVLISSRTEHYTDQILGYEKRQHVMDKYNDPYGYYYICDY